MWLPLVVIGSGKRPAPAEFDENVTQPHRKKYITGWMSEYIRLRASSWRKMLRAMQEARWRPFKPQAIRYLAPAPHSAPSRYGCANATGDLPVITPIGGYFYSFSSFILQPPSRVIMIFLARYLRSSSRNLFPSPSM